MSGKVKAFIVVVIAVLCLATNVWINGRTGVKVGSDFYYKASDTLYRMNKKNYIEGSVSEGFRIVKDGRELTASMIVDGDHVVAEFSNGDRYDCYRQHDFYFDENGEILFLGIISFGEDWATESYLYTLQSINDGGTRREGGLALALVGILVYVVGALSCFFPEEMFFLGRGWQFDHAEMSDAAKYVQMASGIFAMLVGGFLMTGALSRPV